MGTPDKPDLVLPRLKCKEARAPVSGLPVDQVLS